MSGTTGASGVDDHKERVKAHYDSHVKDLSTAEALKQRREGVAAPLKEFHNEIKRRLIYRFAYECPSLLDYACGRGGDIHKWKAARVKYVKGIDLSPAEVKEAQRRYQELKARDRGLTMVCDFEQCDHLGDRDMAEFDPVDAITCMFAIHYFFAAKETLDTFLKNVAGSLKSGGYFLGTVPDGKRIMAHLQAAAVLDQPLLKLTRKWEGPPKKFGSAYVMEIRDTVVEGVAGESEGSDEFLVFASALTKAAAAVGLHPVIDFADPDIMTLFEEADADAPCKHFKPAFPEHCDKSLGLASQLNMAFVFQKAAAPERRRRRRWR
ncbi:MAG: mRNA capping enzyme-domain-containing protein [Monoraphidium minutum]|nr:MAG: mRNA capping enzyme-domain-containing protein [Monoraphidium minutum]